MAMPYDISLICCYTNTVQLDGLKESLKDQQAQIELIALDNRSSRWKSAAAAYNHGASIATAPVLLFSHQDIIFVGPSFLNDFLQAVDQNHDLVVGVAGAVCSSSGFGRDLLSAMYQGTTESRHSTVSGPTPVFTLDECLFGCHRDILSKIRFDEDVCDGWHFYAVDFALQAHVAGARVEVIPAKVVHASGGNRDESYYLAQEKIKKKYRDRFEVIPTTCGWTRTSDIDPYRPIVENELAALRSHGIAYELNFFHAVENSLSLESEDFFPYSASIGAAHAIVCDDADRPFLELLKNDYPNDGVLLNLIKLNNMLKIQRWLLRDLLALHENSIETIRGAYESSLSYRLGSKVLPWSKVDPDVILAPSRNDREESPLIIEKSAVSYLSGEAIENLEIVLKGDPPGFPDALRLLGERLLEEAGQFRAGTPGDLATKMIGKLCFGPNPCVVELVEIQRIWNEAERGMAALRSAYEQSAAYRFGRFLGCTRDLVKGVNK